MFLQHRLCRSTRLGRETALTLAFWMRGLQGAALSRRHRLATSPELSQPRHLVGPKHFATRSCVSDFCVKRDFLSCSNQSDSLLALFLLAANRTPKTTNPASK